MFDRFFAGFMDEYIKLAQAINPYVARQVITELSSRPKTEQHPWGPGTKPQASDILNPYPEKSKPPTPPTPGVPSGYTKGSFSRTMGEQPPSHIQHPGMEIGRELYTGEKAPGTKTPLLERFGRPLPEVGPRPGTTARDRAAARAENVRVEKERAAEERASGKVVPTSTAARDRMSQERIEALTKLQTTKPPRRTPGDPEGYKKRLGEYRNLQEAARGTDLTASIRARFGEGAARDYQLGRKGEEATARQMAKLKGEAGSAEEKASVRKFVGQALGEGGEGKKGGGRGTPSRKGVGPAGLMARAIKGAPAAAGAGLSSLVRSARSGELLKRLGEAGKAVAGQQQRRRDIEAFRTSGETTPKQTPTALSAKQESSPYGYHPPGSLGTSQRISMAPPTTAAAIAGKTKPTGPAAGQAALKSTTEAARKAPQVTSAAGPTEPEIDPKDIAGRSIRGIKAGYAGLKRGVGYLEPRVREALSQPSRPRPMSQKAKNI